MRVFLTTLNNLKNPDELLVCKFVSTFSNTSKSFCVIVSVLPPRTIVVAYASANGSQSPGASWRVHFLLQRTTALAQLSSSQWPSFAVTVDCAGSQTQSLLWPQLSSSQWPSFAVTVDVQGVKHSHWLLCVVCCHTGENRTCTAHTIYEPCVHSVSNVSNERLM